MLSLSPGTKNPGSFLNAVQFASILSVGHIQQNARCVPDQLRFGLLVATANPGKQQKYREIPHCRTQQKMSQ
jgi:hypothetical protein